MTELNKWLESYKKEIGAALDETKERGNVDTDVLNTMSALLGNLKARINTNGGQEEMAKRKHYHKGKDKRKKT